LGADWSKESAIMTILSNVRLGKPKTKPDAPSHTRGVAEGNRRHGAARDFVVIEEGADVRATARRSTGINPAQREPIDPRSPHLTPA
jgi:hypothetical protein